MKWTSPFHEGELKAQRLARETASAESNSAMIGDKILSGALNFLRQQSMVILSTEDSQGHRWASILFGKPGFLEPSDRQTLHISIPETQRDGSDPLWQNVARNPRAGLLVIDLETRRRVRINGDVRVNENEIQVGVTESFAICPKYITKRKVKVASTGARDSLSKGATGDALSQEIQERIRQADVLFLATGHAERGNDASHRGGNPGFVEVVNERTLRMPDYPGNGMFNALGNVLCDPSVGLLFPFLSEGLHLQISAKARILWDQPDPEGRTGGTHRFVEFIIERWLWRPLPAIVETGMAEHSPFNPR